MKNLEVSETTYNNFMKFKKAVEDNSWEKGFLITKLQWKWVFLVKQVDSMLKIKL